MVTISYFLEKAPMVFWWIVIAAAILFYWRSKKVAPLIWVAIFFRIAHAAAQTVYQYYDWKSGALTRLFLPPYQPEDYLLFYSWGRFWLNVVAVLVATFIFYSFLKILQKYRERFFVPGETELGGLCVLIAGWPGFVFFLPFVFATVVLVSIFRMLVLKKTYTTLGYPLLLAAILVLAFGDRLIQIFDWKVLRI